LDTNRSGWAVGWTYFAGFMMIMLGIWHAIAGLSAIIKKSVFTPGGQLGDGYFLKFDVSTWGWIHLILGVLIFLTGLGLMRRATWAGVVAIVLAMLSAIANFFWIPYYPWWSILEIGLAVWVIWAITRPGAIET